VIVPKPLERKERNRESDFRRRNDRPWRKWYNLARWQRTRDRQFSIEPLCAFCLENGKVKSAAVCDHVERHRGDPEKFWNGPFQSLCKACHDGTKQQIEVRGFSGAVDADGWPSDERHPANRQRAAPLSYEAAQRRMPSDLQPSAIPLTIVCGPPGSGKSTYINERIGPNDILIDFDAIQQKLSGRPIHQTTREYLVPTLDERNRMLRALAHDTTHTRAWFIVSAPDPRERATWGKRLGGEVVTMDTPLDECVRRIKADASRRGHVDRMVKAAAEWWSENGCISN